MKTETKTDMKMRITDFIAALKKRGMLLPAVIVLLSVVLLAVGLSSARTQDGGDTGSAGDADEQSRFEQMCSLIDGVGRCRVMMTYTEERTSYYSSEKVKSVSGIAVLCDGGDSAEVKKRITELAVALYGIGANRVRVDRMG